MALSSLSLAFVLFLKLCILIPLQKCVGGEGTWFYELPRGVIADSFLRMVET